VITGIRVGVIVLVGVDVKVIVGVTVSVFICELTETIVESELQDDNNKPRISKNRNDILNVPIITFLMKQYRS
jgi:hypothetical protein